MINDGGKTIELVNPDVEFLKQIAVPVALIAACLVVYFIYRTKMKKLKMKTTKRSAVISTVALVLLALWVAVYDNRWTSHYLNTTPNSCSSGGVDSREIYRTHIDEGPTIKVYEKACGPSYAPETRYFVDNAVKAIAAVFIVVNIVKLYKISRPKKKSKQNLTTQKTS